MNRGCETFTEHMFLDLRMQVVSLNFSLVDEAPTGDPHRSRSIQGPVKFEHSRLMR